MSTTLRWYKYIPISAIAEWEVLTYGHTNSLISQKAGNKRALIEIFSEQRTELQPWLKNYGGRIAIYRPNIKTPQPKIIKIRQKFIVLKDGNPALAKQLQTTYPNRILLQTASRHAFGTGDHATTANCLRLLSDYFKKNTSSSDKRVLDVGCGTGILSVAAATQKAQCLALDNDSNCIKETQRLADKHQLTDAITATQVDALQWQNPQGTVWNLIIANMYSSLLKAILPRYQAWLHPYGNLIISGILYREWHQQKLASWLQNEGWHIIQIIRQGKWLAARLHR